MTCRTGRKGMTLLEVVLAVGLSLGVIAGALGFYNYALDVRRRLETEIQLVESQRRVMELLTDELRRSIGIRFLQLDVKGELQEVSFPCATLSNYADTWEPPEFTENQVPPRYDVPVIGYRLRVVEDEESGEPSIEGLERTVQRIPFAMDPNQEDVETRLLSEHVRFVTFRYWGRGGWRERWSARGNSPQAVEITLGEQPLPDQTEPADYPYPVLRRIVYVRERQ